MFLDLDKIFLDMLCYMCEIQYLMRNCHYILSNDHHSDQSMNHSLDGNFDNYFLKDIDLDMD